MKLKAITATLALALSGIMVAQSADARLVIHCNRGPIPSNPMINGHYENFVASLMENFVMTEKEATRVAKQVCGNMGAVGDLDYLVDLTYEATAPYERR
ncbi:hypothetical protein KUV47_08540 [Vannielia litorea]|uniref:hypothetical protein n=1 Tax=Vannielia TaxID=2813041 RepID=UPI001C93A88E|nr:hypothetical protein [Vannielia litorea]MBY6046829.1 hypothetical protein [Vannielia litorea]MBY6074243.1 hypothetical protein [Vannielia litorea]MBY6153256.1 hypothetical protein [Vannielia litorea]